MSLNVPEMKKMSWNVLESCKISWKVLEINEFSGNLGLFGIWNDVCCSISLKFEIPSTFLGKNFLEISSKMSWKVLEMIPDI